MNVLITSLLLLLLINFRESGSISTADLKLDKSKWLKPGLAAQFDDLPSMSPSTSHSDDDKSCGGGQVDCDDGTEINDLMDRPNYKEDRSNSKEDRSNSKEDRSNSKEDGSISKEDRSNSKEDRSNSKEERSNSKEERSNSKEDRSNSMEVPKRRLDESQRLMSVYWERLVSTLVHHTAPYEKVLERGGKVRATLSLTPRDWARLRSYSKVESVLPMVSEMIAGVELVDDDEYFTSLFSRRFDDVFGVEFVVAGQVLVILLLSLLIFRLLSTMDLAGLSLLRFSLYLFSTIFIVSVPWQWLRLYQASISRRSQELARVPHRCLGSGAANQEEGFWSGLFSLVGSTLGKAASVVVVSTPECERYHDALHIDPILDVTPLRALLHTLLTLVVEPAQMVGTGVNGFLRQCLIDLPVLVQWFLVPAIPVVLVVWLMIHYGYSVRVPFLLHLERPQQWPHQVRGGTDTSDGGATAQIQRLTWEMEQLRLEQHHLHHSLSSPAVPSSTGITPHGVASSTGMSSHGVASSTGMSSHGVASPPGMASSTGMSSHGVASSTGMSSPPGMPSAGTDGSGDDKNMKMERNVEEKERSEEKISERIKEELEKKKNDDDEKKKNDDDEKVKMMTDNDGIDDFIVIPDQK